jgi:hypothetical protein
MTGRRSRQKRDIEPVSALGEQKLRRFILDRAIDR